MMNILDFIPVKKSESLLFIGDDGSKVLDYYESRQIKVDVIEDVSKLCDLQNNNRYSSVILFDALVRDTGIDKAVEALAEVSKYLDESGAVYIAVANRFAMSTFAGSEKRPEGVLTGELTGIFDGVISNRFSKKEIAAILESSDYEMTDIFYPYPDHHDTMCIYSDEKLPAAGELSFPRHMSRAKFRFFDETAALNAVCKEDMFVFFAPSFLVCANKR